MAIPTIKIQGAKELQALLKSLPAKLENKVVRKALRAGGNDILASARANAPVRTGLMKKSIRMRAIKSKGRRKFGFMGVRITTDGRAPYAHLVDQGTQERYTKPDYKELSDKSRYRGKFKAIVGGRAYRGRVSPTRFMEHALTKNADKVIRTFTDAVRRFAASEKARAGI